jgi:hypothetical protein
MGYVREVLEAQASEIAEELAGIDLEIARLEAQVAVQQQRRLAILQKQDDVSNQLAALVE